jgi:hypothetical protein
MGSLQEELFGNFVRFPGIDSIYRGEAFRIPDFTALLLPACP